MNTEDIFDRLRNGEIISPKDPDAYQMIEASFATKKLLVQMNNATEPEEIFRRSIRHVQWRESKKGLQLIGRRQSVVFA